MCGIDFVPPFQGLKFCCHETQGVALGYHAIALSARNAASLKNYKHGLTPIIFLDLCV
jgi:hypothetical protein